MTRHFWFLLLFSVLGAAKSHAVVTLQLSIPNTGVASNFANAGGTPLTNGTPYGVIISTTDSTFNAGAYDPFDISAGPQYLFVNGVRTDDYFVLSANTSITAPNETGAGGVTGGNGGAFTTIGNIPFGAISGGTTSVDATDRWALIWFPSSTANANSAYGLFTDAASSNFQIGGDGVQNKAAYFNGADPIRSAGFTFAAVPEPSRALLLLAGVVGLAVRRRRK